LQVFDSRGFEDPLACGENKLSLKTFLEFNDGLRQLGGHTMMKNSQRTPYVKIPATLIGGEVTCISVRIIGIRTNRLHLVFQAWWDVAMWWDTRGPMSTEHSRARTAGSISGEYMKSYSGLVLPLLTIMLLADRHKEKGISIALESYGGKSRRTVVVPQQRLKSYEPNQLEVNRLNTADQSDQVLGVFVRWTDFFLFLMKEPNSNEYYGVGATVKTNIKSTDDVSRPGFTVINVLSNPSANLNPSEFYKVSKEGDTHEVGGATGEAVDDAAGEAVNDATGEAVDDAAGEVADEVADEMAVDSDDDQPVDETIADAAHADANDAAHADSLTPSDIEPFSALQRHMKDLYQTFPILGGSLPLNMCPTNHTDNRPRPGQTNQISR
jgi:hypothetical protein